MTTQIAAEIASQPAMWRAAAQLGPSVADVLPAAGERVAVIGCGTSYYIGQAYAHLREQSGVGETDAFVASQLPRTRQYDTILALSRSGTTTDVQRVLAEQERRGRRVAVVGVTDSPVGDAADHVISLDFADERSIVQTRFATTALALFRWSLGHDVLALADWATTALQSDVPDPADYDHVVFLANGWAVALAHEAALKLLESAGVWSEAYLSDEYLHGPVSAATGRTLIWSLSALPQSVVDGIAPTGATVLTAGLDPLADLVRVHRYAVTAAALRGRNPDEPQHLRRSVVLA